MKKQNSSSYNIISYNFNVNLAQYNLLREYSRFKTIGTGAGLSFIESCCSPVIGDFMFAVDKLNIQLSFSPNALVTFSVTDPLTPAVCSVARDRWAAESFQGTSNSTKEKNEPNCQTYNLHISIDNSHFMLVFCFHLF